MPEAIAQRQIDTSIQEQSVPKSDKIPDVSPEYIEPKPSERLTLKQPPYILDLLEGKEVYKQFDMESLSNEIDSFINSEIVRQQMKDDKESYQKIFEKYNTKLKLGEIDNIYSRVEKLANYLRIEKKLLDSIQAREDLLNADPLKLSADKLKQLLELKKVKI